jgi:hypothetical protein
MAIISAAWSTIDTKPDTNEPKTRRRRPPDTSSESLSGKSGGF